MKKVKSNIMITCIKSSYYELLPVCYPYVNDMCVLDVQYNLIRLHGVG